jgi:hypothetical protein
MKNYEMYEYEMLDAYVVHHLSDLISMQKWPHKIQHIDITNYLTLIIIYIVVNKKMKCWKK